MGLAAITLAVATGAWAQAPAPAASAPFASVPSAPPAATLREVTVTVNRGVEQAAFDAPASVDVVSGDTLREGQLQINLSESLVRVPGLVIQNRQNYAQDLQISMRGFGARATFGVRGIRLYADGIPATGPDGQGQVAHFDLASAQRVEVLRGPFSALYGNSAGGVIHIVTADGGPATVAEGSLATGRYGTQRLGLKLSGTLGAATSGVADTARPAWSYVLSASGFETDGTRDHSAAQRRSFNAKLTHGAGTDTRSTFVINHLSTPDVQDPLGLTRPEWLANPTQATPVALAFNTRKSVEQTQGGAVVQHRVSAAHQLQASVYAGERRTRQYQSIAVAAQAPATHPGGVIDLARHYEGLDLRWVHTRRLDGKPLTLTAGLAADQSAEVRRGFQNFTGPTTSPVLGVEGALRRDEKNRVRNTDQYLQTEWAMAERFSLAAGVRRSVVRFTSADRYIAPGNGDDSGSARHAATTPALGLTFHASDTLNVYASLGKGFETPTFNELAYRASGATGLNFDLQSARSRHLELGFKAEAGNGWRVNAAIFRAKTDNEIAVLANTGGRSVFQNVGATRRSGLEAAVAGELGPQWAVYSALTYLDARYRDAFRTCTATPCATPAVAIPAGSRMPGIPRLAAYAELVWRHKPQGLHAALEWRHTGRVAVDDRNSDFAPAASVAALRLGAEQKAGRWNFREFLRIDNLMNRRYAGSVIVNEGNARFFEPAPGRTWLIGVTAAHTF